MATCPDCRQPHVNADGKPTCAGHVTYDRDSYVKGQDRKKLDQPRPCRRPPSRGQTKCRMHGGGSPQAKRGAQQRIALAEVEADARAALGLEGAGTIDDPLGELHKLATEIIARRRAINARVNALDEIRYTGGLRFDDDGELIGSGGTEQLRAEVALLERAEDRSMRILELLLKHSKTADVDDAKSMLAKLGEALGIGQ